MTTKKFGDDPIPGDFYLTINRPKGLEWIDQDGCDLTYYYLDENDQLAREGELK